MARDTERKTFSAVAKSVVTDPRAMVAVMFVCMWLVAVLTVQRAYGLGMP